MYRQERLQPKNKFKIRIALAEADWIKATFSYFGYSRLPAA
jgi:hypothetical protein